MLLTNHKPLDKQGIPSAGKHWLNPILDCGAIVVGNPAAGGKRKSRKISWFIILSRLQLSIHIITFVILSQELNLKPHTKHTLRRPWRQFDKWVREKRFSQFRNVIQNMLLFIICAAFRGFSPYRWQCKHFVSFTSAFTSSQTVEQCSNWRLSGTRT